MNGKLLVATLGRRAYGEVLAMQRALCRARLDGAIQDDVLLLVEHPDVITLGRGTQDVHMLHSPAELEQRGYQVFEIERGGDVTYHGPGQLVGYPIIDLSQQQQDLHWYLRQLESALIHALGDLGVSAEGVAGLTGVWTAGRKIASIGIHVKRWVTYHGFALNVSTDVSRFDVIVPCGLHGVAMTSIAQERPEKIDPVTLWEETCEAVVRSMAVTFGRRPTMLASVDVLGIGEAQNS